MPRTKAVKKKAKNSGLSNAIVEQFDILRKRALEEFEASEEAFIKKLQIIYKEAKLSIPAEILNKTVGELQNSSSISNLCTTNSSVLHLLNATKTLTRNRTFLRRSVSAGADDEGYLTAESSSSAAAAAGAATSTNNATTGIRTTVGLGKAMTSSSSASSLLVSSSAQNTTRTSRQRERTDRKTVRISRSLSTRTAQKKQLGSSSVSDSRFKTPGNRIPQATYGTVTPKVMPNAPQVLLRRPNQGEVALSLQGSPLFTSTIVSDMQSHINIPLHDGRLFSIQPQRGLRMSQIPELDADIKRQLETLRDNLNKVCAKR